jgi:hypothetical protein
MAKTASITEPEVIINLSTNEKNMKSHSVAFIGVILFVLVVFVASDITLRSVAALGAPASEEASAVEAVAGASEVGSTTAETSVSVAPSEDSSGSAKTGVTAPVETTSVLSEFNKLSITGSCVVSKATNQKQCEISVTYTSPNGVPVVGIPVTIATMDGEGTFANVDGPQLMGNRPGRVDLRSANLGNGHQADATFVISADATSTLFIALTPAGLRAQSTFVDTTIVN